MQQQPITINPQIDKEWLEVLKEEFEKPYFSSLKTFLISERQKYHIFPKGSEIFTAFNLTPFSKVKVVILGQDPYHGPGQAHGLCFSVPKGVKLPPSLVNIYKELHTDIGMAIPINGNLISWAKQGVFLLNATLTVRAHTAGSHQKKGWEEFTDAAIRTLSAKRSGLVFILWGNYARAKETIIDHHKHIILKAPHPSPLSAFAGFFGCRHFSKTNSALSEMQIEPINWSSVNDS